MIPRICLKTNGINGHKICEICWWEKFAIENKNHKCPGCEKNIPIITNKVKDIIDLT